jgi:hypothetical protein
LVEHLPLPLLWDSVIAPLARKHGYVDEALAAEAPANDVASSSESGEAPLDAAEGAPQTPLPAASLGARTSVASGNREAASRWAAPANAAPQSVSGFKVPPPVVPSPTGVSAPELTVWSAEVNEDDLLDEEESAEVVNS